MSAMTKVMARQPRPLGEFYSRGDWITAQPFTGEQVYSALDRLGQWSLQLLNLMDQYHVTPGWWLGFERIAWPADEVAAQLAEWRQELDWSDYQLTEAVAA